jgi:hypothetical protein
MIEVEWTLIKQGCEHLAKQIMHSIPQDAQGQWHLWGIPRAGMIVATTVHHYMHDCQIHYMSTRPRIKNLVVVDEIADTGKTYSLLTNGHLVRDFFYATIFKRWSCNVAATPDFSYVDVQHNEYLLMPWEKETDTKKELTNDNEN